MLLHEFLSNVGHNLFKPLLLFFYFGFLLPLLKVDFEFPDVIYQGLTMYLLLAIGWHGGEELAEIHASSIGQIVGFMIVGFVLNLAIGMIAYLLLTRFTSLRRIDKATVAGYYGSDSAGTFATAVGILVSAGVAFDAYMPVMLAVMEVPGCLVALFLVARLRQRGMDADGNMPGERGYVALAESTLAAATQPPPGQQLHPEHEVKIGQRHDFSVPAEPAAGDTAADTGKKKPVLSLQLLREVFLNPGLLLLFGGIVIGFISGLQGHKVTHDDDVFFISAFQGALCLFLLEMGMTAARKLRDLRTAGKGFIAFGLLVPNIFAPLGIVVAHGYAYLIHQEFEPGTYVLFAVLCAAASYIAVPAVQRLAIPEASPTLPLAASLGLTFSYNVTIGLPLYIEIAHVAETWFPIT